MTSTSFSIGTSEAFGMLRVKDYWAMVLPNGALITETEVDRPTISTLKGVELNLVALPSKTLHLLQDGVIAKQRAREQRAL